MKKQLLALLITGVLMSASYAQTAYPKPIDPATFDSTVSAGDDFFNYVNGPWVKKAVIPPSETDWGSFTKLYEDNTKLLKQLLENATKDTGKVAKMIGDFYTTGMDSTVINNLGYSPIKPDLQKIADAKDIHSIKDRLFSMISEGLYAPVFELTIMGDPKKTTQNIVVLSEADLGLPDRDYYLNNDSTTLVIRNGYRSYITDLFKLTGVDPATASKNAARIIDLETKMAAVRYSKEELRDITKLYHKFQLNDLDKLTPNTDWKLALARMRIHGQDSIIITHPLYFHYMDSLLSAVPLQTWKVYLKWQIISGAASYLSNDFVIRRFHFYQLLYGQKEIRPRWQRLQKVIDDEIPDLLGQLYVAKYFKPEAKQRMIKLVDNIIETFGERIQRLDWMSAETKTKALLKLEAIKKKIAYPDKWIAYTGLVISKNSYFENVRNALLWKENYQIAKLGKPVDRAEWFTSPQTVNAFYDPLNNDITFPAAILQPPFFYADADDAVIYGAIGSIIGHELTHGFDDQGRLYDKDGNLSNWWAAEDSAKFTIKAGSVIDEYNAFTILDSIHVNGSLTIGENLADLGGLNIAYEAFKKTPEGRSDTLIDGLTPDQRFFISFAHNWQSKMSPEYAAFLIINDQHSPDYWRTNGTVYNLDAFYKAFNIKSGKMYKPEDKRIKVW